MLKLANHRRWFDTIVIYVLQTFQFYLNDSVKASVTSTVKDGINLTTVNLDCVILNSLKKQVKRLPLCNRGPLYFCPVVSFYLLLLQRLSRLGSVTARQSSSERQPNFAALNRGRHLYSAGRPSRWALAHILVIVTFRVSRRQREMYAYIGHARLYVCLSVSVCVCLCLSVRRRIRTLLHGPGCNLEAW